jgi:hypothetical protein
MRLSEREVMPGRHFVKIATRHGHDANSRAAQLWEGAFGNRVAARGPAGELCAAVLVRRVV